jgi:(1->4)-alpha-D-glucan 1-alpha-D-glucosylmutase
MTLPRATYRLQFHRNFKFADAERHVKYFADLGISHIYTSPILSARAGSMHGYDVIDHGAINAELGGEEGFRRLAKALRQYDIGIIVDMVPNHMAVGQADNPWWLDLLAKGPGSAYAGAFDIDWDTPGLEGKVLAPFLNGSPDALLTSGELALIFDADLERHCFAYYGHRFPLRREDQQCTDTDAHAVLNRQHFVLADWREADKRINWRRFFDVTELAAIRVARPDIFEAVHRKIFSLYSEGLIDGVRVDHVDGIADPGAYCRQLRKRLEALRPGAWIVVEKILADGESLPSDWLVDGTTGYDFMNEVSALLHADDNGVLSDTWQIRSGRSAEFESEEIAARREILARKFPAQMRATARAFVKCVPGITLEQIAPMLEALLEKLRCYRGYGTGAAAALSEDCLGKILRENRNAFGPLVDVFGRTDGSQDVEDAIRRFAQLSAPLAAKAVEDVGAPCSESGRGYRVLQIWPLALAKRCRI